MQQELEILQGAIGAVVYQNYENGYSVLRLLCDDGSTATVVGIVQALVATLFVDLALLGLYLIAPDKITPAQAITLGAIATATAPAATLMVVRQYKARGPLTDLLLPVVALVNYFLFFGSGVLNLLPLSWRRKLASKPRKAAPKPSFWQTTGGTRVWWVS